MKNIAEIANEINAIEGMAIEDIQKMKPSEFRKQKKRLDFLKLVHLYLETSPTDRFISGEIQRLERIISIKAGEFNAEDYEKLTKKEVSELRKKHEKMYDLPKFRMQVRGMRFILK